MAGGTDISGEGDGLGQAERTQLSRSAIRKPEIGTTRTVPDASRGETTGYRDAA
jgi:hypothetical protein